MATTYSLAILRAAERVFSAVQGNPPPAAPEPPEPYAEPGSERPAKQPMGA